MWESGQAMPAGCVGVGVLASFAMKGKVGERVMDLKAMGGEGSGRSSLCTCVHLIQSKKCLISYVRGRFLHHALRLLLCLH